MHVILRGTKQDGRGHERSWFIVALKGDGPQIPCVPAIILARKLAQGQLAGAGAMPCVAMVALKEYLRELERFSITSYDA